MNQMGSNRLKIPLKFVQPILLNRILSAHITESIFAKIKQVLLLQKLVTGPMAQELYLKVQPYMCACVLIWVLTTFLNF